MVMVTNSVYKGKILFALGHSHKPFRFKNRGVSESITERTMAWQVYMMAVTSFCLSGLAAGQYTGSFNIDIPFGKLEMLLTVGFELCLI